jgi:hypothetical protein
MKTAQNFSATGKLVLFLLVLTILWLRLFAGSFDSSKNLSTTSNKTKSDGRSPENDYFKQQMATEQSSSMIKNSKTNGLECEQRNGKGQMEPSRDSKQSTNSVLLFRSVENPSNLTTSKLITKLNFNKKSCEKIFSSNNRLRLNFNGEKSKQWKRGQDAIRRNQSKIGMTSESVPGRKVGKKHR